MGMTVETVKERLAEIRQCAHDDEKAHALEDKLFLSVLGAIADGHPDPMSLAQAVCGSVSIEFERWCA